jgi:beta-lactam-binding protein with PASTA domain
VTAQEPAPGSSVPTGTVVALGRVAAAATRLEALPDLSGLALREAIARLRGVGVEVRVEGVGVVAEQSPASGTAIVPGLVCRLRLAPGQAEDEAAPEPLEPAVPSVLTAAGADGD